MNAWAVTGVVVGLVVGTVMAMGMFTIAAALSGLWIGNSLHGICCGQILSMVGHGPRETKEIIRRETPFKFWIFVLCELIVGVFVAIYCLREFSDSSA